jgi:hypothetical protein
MKSSGILTVLVFAVASVVGSVSDRALLMDLEKEGEPSRPQEILSRGAAAADIVVLTTDARIKVDAKAIDAASYHVEFQMESAFRGEETLAEWNLKIGEKRQAQACEEGFGICYEISAGYSLEEGRLEVCGKLSNVAALLGKITSHC